MSSSQNHRPSQTCSQTRSARRERIMSARYSFRERLVSASWALHERQVSALLAPCERFEDYESALQCGARTTEDDMRCGFEFRRATQQLLGNERLGLFPPVGDVRMRVHHCGL